MSEPVTKEQFINMTLEAKLAYLFEMSQVGGSQTEKHSDLLRLLARCEIFIRSIDAENGRHLLADIRDCLANAKVGGA